MGTSFLENISVATPCPANWDDMSGDDQCRHCSLCKLNVFNISEMTENEAEKLILEKEGADDRLCIRFYRRPDGTILTQNCPVGLLRVRRRLVKALGAFAAMITLFFSLFGVSKALTDEEIGHKPAFSKFYHWLNPDCETCAPNIMGEAVMGDMMVMPAPPIAIMGKMKIATPTPTPKMDPTDCSVQAN